MPIVVRPAGPDDAEALARLAAVTFPLACPPDADPKAVASFVAAHLGSGSFAAYLTDPDRDILVAVHDAGPADATRPTDPMPDGTEPGGTEPIGYTMLVEGEPLDPDVDAAVASRPTAELSKCYVHPDHHGAGVAALLISRTVEAARVRGLAGIWLGVNQQNARADRFYERQGFVRVGTRRFALGDRWEDDFVRERLL